MNRKEKILKIREYLLSRRKTLRKVLDGDMDSMNGLRGQEPPGDTIDNASGTIQETVNSQLAEVSSRVLKRIEEALERMRLGTFGICECGALIPVARFEALPYATTCIKCQQELERQAGSSSSSAMEMAMSGDDE